MLRFRSQKIDVQAVLLSQTQPHGIAPQIGRGHRIQIVDVLCSVDVELLVVQPIHPILFVRTRSVGAVVGVVEKVEPSKLHMGALQDIVIGVFAVSTGDAWRVSATTVASSVKISMGPPHFQVANLRVASFGQNAGGRICEDDLEAVGFVAFVVVVADINVIDIHGLWSHFVLDFPDATKVCVGPIPGDLVVPCRRKANGVPIKHIPSKRNLTVGVDVKEVVFGAIEVERPWVGNSRLVDWDGG